MGQKPAKMEAAWAPVRRDACGALLLVAAKNGDRGSAAAVVQEDVHQNAADRDVEPDGLRHTCQPRVMVEAGRARRGG